MGEGEEIAEQFLRFPSKLNATQMRDYEELYHPDFEAILPSVNFFLKLFCTSDFRYKLSH